MDSPPHSPQTSPLQVSPLAMRPPNPDSPPQETPPPPPTATYKRKIRSKSTRPMASAPPLAKRKDPPTTPLSEPPPKNPKTSTSTRHEAGVSTSTPQAKSPSSSKKQTSAATQVSKLPWPLPDAAHKATFKRLKDRKVQPTSLPPSDTAQPAADTEPTAQPEAQSVPPVQQHSTEPTPPPQSAQDIPADSAQPTPSAAGPSSSTVFKCLKRPSKKRRKVPKERTKEEDSAPLMVDTICSVEP
ncbi:proline-rich receptor-like protein kinase PERK10 [Hevea brasiliensis]|uniref:proline-rich receptor-like protein kinase PERK10 n=1 Tax=Hevea brasiliensis TaxID=3981 RepID=UPI0025F17EBD|nr:proline-rich receptor-like protein kinase PERK10 [Hevea brasiliensis]